jgi:hypothetical protein
VDTNRLIRELAAQPSPVRRLPAPWIRASIWLAISIPYVAAIVLLHARDFDVSALFADRQLVVEQVAILLTALAALLAAFCSVVPGYDRRILLLPVVPLAVWMGVLGESCIGAWLRSDAVNARLGWECLPPTVLVGIVPAVAIVVMLRRGAPLSPGISLALGALAVAALSNFALRTFHPTDASLLVLAVHLGSVAALALAGAWIGGKVLKWRTLRIGAAR